MLPRTWLQRSDASGRTRRRMSTLVSRKDAGTPRSSRRAPLFLERQARLTRPLMQRRMRKILRVKPLPLIFVSDLGRFTRERCVVATQGGQPRQPCRCRRAPMWHQPHRVHCGPPFQPRRGCGRGLFSPKSSDRRFHCGNLPSFGQMLANWLVVKCGDRAAFCADSAHLAILRRS